MGFFQRAGLALLLAVGLLDAEQLLFHALRRDRGGIDDDKRPFGAARGRMQRARRQLLAGPGGADDQDAAVGLGRAVDGLAQLVHAGRAAGQDARRRRHLLQLPHLALEPRGFQRPGRDQDQPVGLERLFDEVIGAALDRRDRGLDVAVAGDHHDRQVGMVLLDLLEQLQAVELGALQPDVEKHQMRAAIGDLGQRGIAVARRPRRKPLVIEDARDEIADIGLVIDNQNVTCHGSRPACQLPVAASIFVSLLVASAGPLVSSAAAFVSADGCCRCSLVASAAGWLLPRLVLNLDFGFAVAGDGKTQPHPGPALARPEVGGVLQLDLAAMVFQHAANDGEPQAVPFSRVVT